MKENMLVLFPDERLRQISSPITFPAFGIDLIVEDMLKVMYEHKGIGLSAIQIGIPIRLVVADIGEGKEIYVNPTIKKLGGVEKLMNEGCLSFPDIYLDVKRFNKITISYKDLEGNDKTLNTGGIRAQMLQHEIEHLDGILLEDKK